MKLVVIGGVAAGASFAARARRLSESADITLLEKGPDVSFANCGLPYFIGGDIQDRSLLALQTPRSLQMMLNLNVRTLTKALNIDRKNKRVLIQTPNQKKWLPYDKLMLAPGAQPIIPNIPGIDDPRILTLRNLQDMDKIVDTVQSAQNAVIIGAGFIGLEMAEQLHQRGLNVHIVQNTSQVLPLLDKKLANLLHNELIAKGISIHFNTEVVRFDSKELLLCHLSNGKTLSADMVIVSIGIRPENQLAKDAGLQLGTHGHIVVNDFMQTSDPDIYAAGDVVETKERSTHDRISAPLGGLANRQGRVAADHIFLGKKARPYPGTLGTAIVRVFGLAAGLTGLTEKALQEHHIPYNTVTVRDQHHASYYPGAKPLTLKIFWNTENGVLLGAQAVGAEGVDKRLDVLSVAISTKMTIDDLCHLEFAYAPPFGSAKDVINLAGFAATNIEDGLVDIIDDFPENTHDVQIIDVRSTKLAKEMPISGALNIPYGQLRDQLDQLDKTKPVITVCMVGKTSYFAARILAQHGFKVKSLTGGILVNQKPSSN